VRIAESLLRQEEPSDLPALFALVSDPDPHVRLQLAYSLGESRDPRAGTALAALAADNAGDPYIMAAVSSSAPPHLEAMAKAATEGGENERLYADVLTLSLAAGDEAVLARLLEPLASTENTSDDATEKQFRRLGGLLAALNQRGDSLADLQRTVGRELRERIARLDAVFERARGVAADADAPTGLRGAAVPLLRQQSGKHARDLKLLAELLEPKQPIDVQLAAAARLGSVPGGESAAVLLDPWQQYTPRLRSEVLAATLQRPALTSVLLDRIESGLIANGELSAAERDRLLSHADEAIRRRAETVLGKVADTSRQEVLEEYAAALTAKGDLARGAAAFKQHCAKCHKLGDEGREVGPDLKSLTDRSPKAMLTAVLDPNRAVEAKFRVYSVELADGRVLKGVLAEETGGGIRLLDADKAHDVPRGEIVTLAAGQKSLMPEGIEKDVSLEQMTDLLEYLREALK
jgi:putative heme-binding domain-containing protein